MQALVAIWERDVNGAHSGFTLTQKLAALDLAVADLSTAITAQNILPGNLVKGIFAAPEYLLAARYAGQQILLPTPSGVPLVSNVPRSLSEVEKNQAVQHLLQLSRRYPRILIFPGSIAWIKPTNLNEAQRDLDFYRRHDKFVTVKNAIKRLLAWSAPTNQVVIKALVAAPGSLLLILPVGVRDLNDLEVAQIMKKQGIGVPDLMGRSWFEYVQLQSNPLLPRMQLAEKQAMLDLAMFGAPVNTMRNSCYVLLNGGIRFLYNKQGDFHENIGANSHTVFIPGGQKGYTEIEGIKFGVEICLDHAIGILQGQANNRQLPDIHVITSAWVNQVNNNVRVRSDNGFLIHASSNPAVCGVWESDVFLGLQRRAPLATNVIDGSNLRYYRINCRIDDDEPLDLGFLNA